VFLEKYWRKFICRGVFKMNRKKLLWKWLGMAVVLVCSSSVWAGFTDGFESGLGGWTTSGQVQTVDYEYPRNLGLSNDWLPTKGNYFASLWSTDNADATSAELSRTFDGVAGETLQFDYYFDLNDADMSEGPVSGSDWARADLSGYTLFEKDELTAGWQTRTYVLPDTRTYTLTFSAFDADGTFESVLGVDRISLGSASVVPAPGALLLGAIGLGTIGGLRKKGYL
jgi:hypothetical protein